MFKAILLGVWYSLVISPYAMFLYIKKGKVFSALDVFVRSPYFLIPFVAVWVKYGWVPSVLSLVVFSLIYTMVMFRIIMQPGVDIEKVSKDMVDRSQPYMEYVDKCMADGERLNSFTLTRMRIELT